jgi:plastocyanin
MLARKSAGITGRFAAIVVVAGLTLVLLAGAIATSSLVRPPSVSTSISQQNSSTTSGPWTTGSSVGTTRTSSSTESVSSTYSTRSTDSTSTISTTSSSTYTSSATSKTSTSTSSTSRTTTTATTTTTTATTTTTSTTSTSSRPGTAQIVLPVDVGNNESLNFQPSKIVVVIGVNNTVVWVDLDYVQHTVKSVTVPGGAKSWGSGILNQGQTFTVTLTVPGNYRYFCSIHPDWMVGTIQVVQ